MKKRWVVIFSSDPEPPFDATVVDVVASQSIEAIAIARKLHAPQHPWTCVQAHSWPSGCNDIDEAAAALLANVS